MSFIDEARTESTSTPRAQCTAGAFLEGLSDTERAEVVEAMEDPTITAAAIARVIGRRYESARVTAGVLRRHRRGECRCG